MFRPSKIDNSSYLIKNGERYYRHRGHGFVAESAQVDEAAFVDRTSIVHPGAVVSGPVVLEEGTEVGKNARLAGKLRISRTVIPEGETVEGEKTIHKGRATSLAST